MSAARFAFILAMAGLAAGCIKPPVICPSTHVGLEVLTDRHNANAEKIPRLWARARVEVSLTNQDGRKITFGSTSPLARGNAKILLAKGEKATDFVLIGQELGPEIFRAGTDAAAGVSYLWYNWEKSGKVWYGRAANAGAPGVTAIPIDPAQLIEVLGVTPLPEVAPGAMPATVMTLSTDPCAYIVQYLKHQPVTGLLKVWREVYFRWDDKQPPLPFHVRLYDAEGFCRVMADVSDYAAIETDQPEEDRPIMPTYLKITWPAITNVQTASSLNIRLTELSTLNPFSQKVFSFWPHLPPGISPSGIIQVDAAYGPLELPEQDLP